MNAVITGATKGIGKAIALELASQGYQLAVCARNELELEALQAELKLAGIKALTVVADCSIKEEVLSFCETITGYFDQVDILVNNVGVFLPANLLDEPDEAFEYQQRVNLNAAYYLSKNIGKMMREQQKGHIFNICSIASSQVVAHAGSYSVTKTSLLSLNHVLRKELSAYHVKVTAILPGSTLTASWEGTTISPEKFVQPADIAKSITAILQLSDGVNVDEMILTPLNF
jgi:3-oxoacyl-[acyl-carrier protein] reductase